MQCLTHLGVMKAYKSKRTLFLLEIWLLWLTSNFAIKDAVVKIQSNGVIQVEGFSLQNINTGTVCCGHFVKGKLSDSFVSCYLKVLFRLGNTVTPALWSFLCTSQKQAEATRQNREESVNGTMVNSKKWFRVQFDSSRGHSDEKVYPGTHYSRKWHTHNCCGRWGEGGTVGIWRQFNANTLKGFSAHSTSVTVTSPICIWRSHFMFACWISTHHLHTQIR